MKNEAKHPASEPLRTINIKVDTNQTPRNQRRRQQTYWVPNAPTAVGVGALLHGLYHLLTVSDDRSGSHAASIPPVPYKKTDRKNKQAKTRQQSR